MARYGIQLCRRIPLCRRVLRLLVEGTLVGWAVACPAKGLAQSASGWSSPRMLYDGMVKPSGNTLIADQFGGAHLVWSPADGQAYYYSRWDGTTWTPPLDIVAVTGDLVLDSPDLVPAEDGKLHLFWAQGSVLHSWAWMDQAAASARAWSAPEAVVTPTGHAQGRVDAMEDSRGRLHLVYAVRPGGVYYTHMADGDLSWTEPAAVGNGADSVTASAPRLDLGPDGRIHVVWEEWPSDGDPAESSEVYYAHSTNGGADWSEPQQLGELANRGGNVLATDDGTVYLAWQAGIGSPHVGRFVQRSPDGGATWETPLSFSQIMGQSGFPCLALDSQGTLHILTGDGEYAAWEGRSVSTPLDLRPVPEQTEQARLAILSGNQLLVAIGPFWSPGLYYTVKKLPLAALPTRMPLAPEPTIADAAPLATGDVVSHVDVTGAATPQPRSNMQVGTESTPSAARGLLLGAGVSLALVTGVALLWLWRRVRG